MTPDMNQKIDFSEITPPRLINSLMAGFQSVASHAWVIVLPVLMDIFLWFTPRLRVDSLLMPLLESSLEQAQKLSAANEATMILMRDYLSAIIKNFNLNGAIHSFPIGVPSLLSGIEGAISPLGLVPVEQVSTVSYAFLIFFGLTVLGLILGGVFFNQVAGTSQEQNKSTQSKKVIWKVGQSLLLTLALFILSVVITIPGLMLSSLVTLISPAVGQLALLLLIFLLFWFAVPWFYVYHGIFVFGMGAVQSTLTSLRIGRVFLTRTASLIMLIIIMSQGLNMLWITPPPSSWLLLMGIFGHAIVSAGLLSGSIIYYRQITSFLEQLAALRQKGMTKA